MTLRLLALALTAPLALAACGDDETTDTGGTTDAGTTDTGTTDTGGGDDSGVTDAGGEDTGETDAGGEDTGETDTGGDDTGGEDTGETDAGGAVDLDTMFATVIEPSCGGAGCHLNGAAAGGINLDNDGTLAARLLATALQAPIPYVTPGDVDASYLWHKVQGTQDLVGGSGSRMPLVPPFLTDDQLNTLQAWIEGL